MKTKKTVKDLSSHDMARLLEALRTAEESLGTVTTIRQLMTLLIIALANQSGRELGVSDIDKALGDLLPGSASRLLRSMMHEETVMKAGVAGTITAERHPTDLRKVVLHVTPKGIQALSAVISQMQGKRDDL